MGDIQAVYWDAPLKKYKYAIKEYGVGDEIQPIMVQEDNIRGWVHITGSDFLIGEEIRSLVDKNRCDSFGSWIANGCTKTTATAKIGIIGKVIGIYQNGDKKHVYEIKWKHKRSTKDEKRPNCRLLASEIERLDQSLDTVQEESEDAVDKYDEAVLFNSLSF